MDHVITLSTLESLETWELCRILTVTWQHFSIPWKSFLPDHVTEIKNIFNLVEYKTCYFWI